MDKKKIRGEKDDTRDKLSFLSDERYLTFLGGLSYDGGTSEEERWSFYRQKHAGQRGCLKCLI